MCGRVFNTYRARQVLRQAGTGRMRNQNNYKAGYNLGPGNYVPVIRHSASAQDNHREVDVVKWGFHTNFGGTLNNARSEEASGKQTFKGLVNTTRCVMMVEGYFEWAPGKKPFVFRSNTENKLSKVASDDDEDDDNAGDKAPILYIAGLIASDGSLIVMTRDALPGFKDIHHRMPVILDESEIDMWLDCKNYKYDNIIFSEILKNEKEKWSNVSYYQVGPLVNNMNNDNAKIIEPVRGLPKELAKPKNVPNSTGQSTNASGKSTPCQPVQGRNLDSFLSQSIVPRANPVVQPTQQLSQGNLGNFLGNNNAQNVPKSIASTQPATQKASLPIMEQSTIDDECRIGDEDSGIWDETPEEEKVPFEEKKAEGKVNEEEDWEGLYDVLWGDDGEVVEEKKNERVKESKKRKERDGEELERDNFKQVKMF